MFLDDGRLVPAPPSMPPPPPPSVSQRSAVVYFKTPDGRTIPHRIQNPRTAVRSPDGRVCVGKRLCSIVCDCVV